MIRFEPASSKGGSTDKSNKTKKANTGVSLELNSANVVRLIFIGLITIGGYLTWRAYTAEQNFRRALAAAPTNGVAAYNLLQKSTQQHPYDLKYRLNYSQVNLALANVLSQPRTDENGNQATPSAQTVATVRQLVAQAVREGKIAVSLAPNDPLTWANLAAIYRALIGVAGGAADWAAATYERAVALNPTDPLLRLSLGGVYFTRGNALIAQGKDDLAAREYEKAINQFSLSSQLKPSLANAWYNLAQAFKARELNTEALEALNQTLALLSPELKNDRAVVEKEIAELKGEDVEIPASGQTEKITEPTESSPSAKNVPPPVEVEGPPPAEATPAAEPIRIRP